MENTSEKPKKSPKKRLTQAELEENRKEFIKISKEYFEEHGIELTPENGEKIPKDLTIHQLGLKEGWSVDIYILTTEGIRCAYYRGKDPHFTMASGLMDPYLKDVKLASNKFLYSLEELMPLIKHLKVR